MDHRASRATVVIVAALAIVPLPVAASGIEEIESESVEIVIDDDWDEHDAEQWQEIVEAVAVLEDGAPEDRLELLSAQLQYGDPFEFLEGSPPDDPSGAGRILDRLAAVIDGETDPWITYLLAKSLSFVDHPGATEIFATLSRHAVPSVRGTAVFHSGYLHGDDDRLDETLEALLLDMWASERTPWVRADLIRRLADFEIASIVDECVELLDDVDPDLVAAAVYCVDSFDVPDSERLLARRAADGDDVVREHALRTLTGREPLTDEAAIEVLESMWRSGRDRWARTNLMRILDRAGSTQVVDDARVLAWDDDRRVASTAISMLGRHRRPGDLVVLMERCQRGDEQLRASALRALDSARLAPEVEAIVLQAVETVQPEVVRAAAVEILSGRLRHDVSPSDAAMVLEDRRRYGSILREIEALDPSEWVRRIASLGADALEGNVIVRFHGCGGSRSGLDGTYRLVATAGEDSVRCHDRPGHEMDPANAIRITTTPGGAWRGSRFDDGVDVWFSVNSLAPESCWLPANQVRRVGPSEVVPAPSTLSVQEIDVSIERTRTESFRELEEAGLVMRFDEGETLVGVRLAFDPVTTTFGSALLRKLRD